MRKRKATNSQILRLMIEEAWNCDGEIQKRYPNKEDYYNYRMEKYINHANNVVNR